MSDSYFVISLRIKSYKTDPSEICDSLKLRPKIMNKINELRVDNKGTLLGGVYEYSYFISRVCEKKDFKQFEEAVKKLLNEFSEHKELFQNIRQEGGSSEFFIGWFTGFNSGFVLDYSLLKQMGELGIDLNFDIYGED